MPATPKTLPFVVLSALALPLAWPALAQDATPEEPAATEAPDAAAPDATAAEPAPEGTSDAPADATDLSLGQPVADGVSGAAEPQVGETYIRQTFGSWSQRCLKAEEGQPDPCQLYQLLSDAEGNAVAEISMFPLPEAGEAAAGATIVTPLETLLTENLTLSVDGTGARQYPFTFCNAAGCLARVGFTAQEIEQLKAGDSATLRLVPAAAPDQEVVLTISLSGFTAGYDAQQSQPGQ